MECTVSLLPRPAPSELNSGSSLLVPVLRGGVGAVAGVWASVRTRVWLVGWLAGRFVGWWVSELVDYVSQSVTWLIYKSSGK